MGWGLVRAWACSFGFPLHHRGLQVRQALFIVDSLVCLLAKVRFFLSKDLLRRGRSPVAATATLHMLCTMSISLIA
jgi:uncharacterized membrane protein